MSEWRSARGCALADVAPPSCVSQVDVALSNSFGFGGHNSCIMFGQYKP